MEKREEGALLLESVLLPETALVLCGLKNGIDRTSVRESHKCRCQICQGVYSFHSSRKRKGICKRYTAPARAVTVTVVVVVSVAVAVVVVDRLAVAAQQKQQW